MSTNKLETLIANSPLVPEDAKDYVVKYLSPAAETTYRGLGTDNDCMSTSYSDCTSFTFAPSTRLPGFEECVTSAAGATQFETTQPWNLTLLLDPSLDGVADFRVDYIKAVDGPSCFTGRLKSGQPIIENKLSRCYGQGYDALVTPVPVGLHAGVSAPVVKAAGVLYNTADSAWGIASKYRVTSASLTITQDATSLTDSGTVFSAPIGNSFQANSTTKPQTWDTNSNCLNTQMASGFEVVGAYIPNDPTMVPMYTWRSTLPRVAEGDMSAQLVPMIMQTPGAQSRPLKGEGGGEYAIYRATDFSWQNADPCAVENPLAHGFTWPDVTRLKPNSILVANSGCYRYGFAPAIGSEYRIVTIRNIAPTATVLVKAVMNIDVVADLGSPFQPFANYAPYYPGLCDVLAKHRHEFGSSFPHSYNMFGWLASAARAVLPAIGRVARAVINPSATVSNVASALARPAPAVKEVVRVVEQPPRVISVPVAVKEKTKKKAKVVSTKVKRKR